MLKRLTVLQHFKNALSTFDNVEKMWMQGTRNTATTRAQYKFASDMIKNLIHVKVFYIEDIDIHYISQDIAKLSKLEI